MEYKLHDYQEFLKNKIIETPKVALFVKMGLGKTLCVLSALDELMFDYFEIRKALIIAPLRVADYTWEEEIDKFGFRFTISKILGTKEQRIKAVNTKANIYTVNLENSVWLAEYCVKNKSWPFDCLIFDESSAFKNQTSKRFKAYRKITPHVKRVILLTGTPSPNGLMNLWSQIYLLDQGLRLGKTITGFRNKYFKPLKYNGHIVYKWGLLHGAKEQIYKAISDITVSLDSEDHIKQPDCLFNYIKVKMPDDIKKTYKRLERDYVLAEENIVASSAGVLANKLLQLANGCVYDEATNEVLVHDLKLEALDEILEYNEGEAVLVFYNYKHDLARLKERYRHLNPRQLLSAKDKKDWDAGKIRLLLAHPASMGHGLNLQAGGNVIVWFGLNWSLELYQQANARLHRQGQKNTVVINHLMTEGTIDEDVISRLEKKETTQQDLINAVKARIVEVKNEIS